MRSNAAQAESGTEGEISDISSDEDEEIDSDDVDSDDLDGEYLGGDDEKTDSDIPEQRDFVEL